MKTLVSFVLAGMLAADAADRTPPPERSELVEPWTEKTVRVGDFLWEGFRYRDATARLRDVNTIQFRSPRDGGGYIPWNQAPAILRQRLATEHKAATEAASHNREIALAKWRRENGTFQLAGKITRITPTGTTIQQDGSAQLFWFNGQRPNAKAGDRINFEAKRSGTHTDKNPQGVVTAIPVIVASPLPKHLLP